MARSGLILPIFIASPSDMNDERLQAKEIIRWISRKRAPKASRTQHKEFCLPMAIEWKDCARGMNMQKRQINPLLDSSELVIAIVGQRLGTPYDDRTRETRTQWEVLQAIKRWGNGEIDDVLVYYCTYNKDGYVDERQRVEAFLDQLESDHPVQRRTCTSLDDFRISFHNDLVDWQDNWQDVSTIVFKTLKSDLAADDALPDGEAPPMPGQNEHTFLTDIFGNDVFDISNCLGRIAQEHYLSFQIDGATSPLEPDVLSVLDDDALANLVKQSPISRPGDAEEAAERGGNRSPAEPPFTRKEDESYYFTSVAWFRFLYATGLLQHMGPDSSVLIKSPERIIAQDLPGCVQAFAAVHPQVITQLLAWLDDTTVDSRIRATSAMVLGKARVKIAEDSLAANLGSGNPRNVRSSCAIALGHLRSRTYLHLLTRMYWTVTEEDRLEVGQVVCNIVGAAHYDL